LHAVSLSRSQLNLIERCARAVIPREYCAALLGQTVGLDGLARVELILGVRNCDGRLGRFAVAQVDLDHVHAVARERGLTMLGLLHSHPNHSAELSWRDQDGIAIAAHPWFIVSLAARSHVDIACYASQSGRRIPITVTDH
jgi:proteasome lid subunit RPN8/RPN11